jgi:hypothetical protein
MPTIDFTLDDFKSLMREEISTALESEREATRNTIAHALAAEREVTRLTVRDEVADQFHVFIKDIFQPALDLIDHRFDRIDVRFDRLESDVAGLKRVVRKHSADIDELQALSRI